jgi:osmoprotectant transport system permease protein
MKNNNNRLIAFFVGLLICLSICLVPRGASARETVTVGSKSFTEGYVLSELIAQVIESTGEADVVRKFGLGGSGILAQAIEHGSVDIYPEYSGTAEEEILKSPRPLDSAELDQELQKIGLVASNRLGFNNTYAIAVREQVAKENKLESISDLKGNLKTDLKRKGGLRFGFSHEFVKRKDGLSRIEEVYDFYPAQMSSMEHALAYEALRNGQLEGTDVYSTDAKIEKFDLRVLRDDRHAFPDYDAFFLARADFPSRFPKSWAALQKLRGQISEKRIRDLNAEVELDRRAVSDVVASAFHFSKSIRVGSSETFQMIALRTKQHLTLVLTSLLAAILIGVPLGVISAKWGHLGTVIMAMSSVLQTIPSLALLVFLIPFFGIGVLPALVALFLYALLPIVVNTFLGLKQIDPLLLETELSLGLTSWQRLRLIELPLASPLILGGIRTSAVIGIGTATLAALIGAGGYGVPIVMGLTLNDLPTILQGAIPAAVLALVAQGFFAILRQIVIPRGIRAS